MNFEEQAIEFIKDIFHTYLELGDFDSFIKMLDDNITWIGSGAHEICRNHEEAEMLFMAEKKSWDGNFKILDQWYHGIVLSEEYCNVYGELRIREDGLRSILIDMHSRFTMLCKRDEHGMTLVHAHFSVPNASQHEDEFVHKSIAEDYNELLEKKLMERTRNLKSKSKELELLMSNIQGGVQICKYDEHITILYLNQGFYDLTGYNEKEVKELFHNHSMEMVLHSDLELLKKEINAQLEYGDSFILEYRMKRKDGKIIWVLDNGRFITDENGERRFYCVLTDITHIKILEEELRIKTIEMQTIYDNVDFGIMKGNLTKDTSLQFINNRALHILGYTREQFKSELGDKINAIPMDFEDDTLEKYTKLLEEKDGPIRYKVKAKKRDGSIIWLTGYGIAIKNQRKERVGIFTFQDITEDELNRHILIQKNEELMISEKRYELAIQYADIIMFDYIFETGQLILPNDSINKYNLPEVIDHAFESNVLTDIIHTNSLEDYREGYKRIIQGEPYVRSNILLIDKNGHVNLNEINLTNIFDDTGKPIRVIGILRDITELSLFKKEKKYSNAMTYDKLLTYEINISKDLIEDMNTAWAKLLNIPNCHTFSALVEFLCENSIHPDNINMFRNFCSKEAITDALNNGTSQVSIQYRRKSGDSTYNWVQNTMNIIKEDITNDIKIRCYVSIINDQKKKELKAQEEQRFYEVMLNKSALVYEINISKNIFIRGHENWYNMFAIKPTNNYSEMMNQLTDVAIFSEDVKGFQMKFFRNNLLTAYHNGAREIYYEYRRPGERGGLIWVSCTMHLLEDPITGEIKGYSYVQNINNEKMKEIDLLYKAEHDALTGLYNKSVTEQCINSFLRSEGADKTIHAFYIFDIDYFKQINDNFGHAFGDIVLSQFSRKIKDLFRDYDILGRIGGDEFVVFMKNIPSVTIAINKAIEICNYIKENYKQGGKVYSITTSIGIAIYPNDGVNYQELYKHSDTALYSAKENGRDQYSLYNNAMSIQRSSMKTTINDIFVESKSFQKNMCEYIFRILYESYDKIASINMVLELVGREYQVSRAYIFEDSEDGMSTSNTFEWCNEGIPTQKKKLQNISYDNMKGYKENFNEMGMFSIQDAEKTNKLIPEYYNLQNINSILQFVILKNDQFGGFVGFDHWDASRKFSKEDMIELKYISNIVGVFLMEMRAAIFIEATKNVALSIVNGLDSYAYVIDRNSFELLFINNKTKELAKNSKEGECCYQAFWFRETPCELCPMFGLTEDKNSKCSIDLYNHNFNIWTKAAASWIEWTDGKRACLLDCVDITEYKKI